MPGAPLAALIVLLSAVTMAGALYLAAKAATYPEILHGDRYALGTAVTTTTLLFAQVAGSLRGASSWVSSGYASRCRLMRRGSAPRR